MTVDKKIIQCGDPNYSEITFAWEVNTNCQYRCDYCVAHARLTKEFIEKYRYVYINILKRLDLNSIGSFKMELVGGEPMLHPDIYEIVESLYNNKKCTKISMNTNLVKTVEDYERFDDTKYKNLEFSASFHPQYHKKIDTFLEKIKVISRFKYTRLVVNVNLIDNETYIPLYKTLIKFCRKYNICIQPNYIFSTSKFESSFSSDFFKIIDCESICDDLISYEFEDGEVCDLKLSDLYEKELTGFKGYNCIPKMWIIRVDGLIRNMCTGETLNVLNRNLSKCVSCPRESCNCEELYMYHKTAPGEKQPIN
jgi:MoaA/NifB/PqqE/SkfB family radical SAM enzyme